jgi:hypothetical protein
MPIILEKLGLYGCSILAAIKTAVIAIKTGFGSSRLV